MLNGERGRAVANLEPSKIPPLVAGGFVSLPVPSDSDLGAVGDIALQKKGAAPWKVGVIEVEATHDASMRVAFQGHVTLDGPHNDLRVDHEAAAAEPAVEFQQNWHPEYNIFFWWDGKPTGSTWEQPHKWWRGRFVPAGEAPGAPVVFVGLAGEPEHDWVPGATSAGKGAAAAQP